MKQMGDESAQRINLQWFSIGIGLTDQSDLGMLFEPDIYCIAQLLLRILLGLSLGAKAGFNVQSVLPYGVGHMICV